MPLSYFLLAATLCVSRQSLVGISPGSAAGPFMSAREHAGIKSFKESFVDYIAGQKAFSDCVRDQISASLQPEFFVNSCPVGFDCFMTQTEVLGNFPICETASYSSQYLNLALAQKSYTSSPCLLGGSQCASHGVT